MLFISSVAVGHTYATSTNATKTIATPFVTATTNVPVTKPLAVAFDSTKNIAYVGSTTGSISLISDSTNKVIKTLHGFSSPQGIAFDPHKKELFVPNYFSNNVSVISDSTNTVVATVSGGFDVPGGVAFDSHTNSIYVTNQGKSDTVLVISDSTNKVTATIPVGTEAKEGQILPLESLSIRITMRST